MNVVDIKRFESMVYNSFNLHRDAKVIRIADINDDGFSTYFKDTYVHSYFKCRRTYVCMYGARNIEMSIRFSLKSRPLNDFIGQKCLKLKLRSAFVPL